MKATRKERERLKRPRILQDYLSSTDQSTREHEPLSESHLLNEAEWCLYNAYENEASAAFDYHHASKAALRRYVDSLRARGVNPKRDFD